MVQTLADWVYGYVTQKRALTLIPGYHPRYPDTQVPPLSITEVIEVARERRPWELTSNSARHVYELTVRVLGGTEAKRT